MLLFMEATKFKPLETKPPVMLDHFSILSMKECQLQKCQIQLEKSIRTCPGSFSNLYANTINFDEI